MRAPRSETWPDTNMIYGLLFAGVFSRGFLAFRLSFREPRSRTSSRYLAMAAFAGFDSALAGAASANPTTPVLPAMGGETDALDHGPPMKRTNVGVAPTVQASGPSGLLAFAAHHRVNAKVTTALLRSMGAEADDMDQVFVSDFGLMTETDAMEAMANATLEDGQSLNGLQKGMTMRLWRASSAYAALTGLGPNGPIATSPPAASSAPSSSAVVTAPPVLKKCAELLDQGSDLQFTPLPLTEINQLRLKFEEKTGDEPDAMARPTADQLGALKCVLASGRAPFADLGLFGPFGDRTSKLRRFQAQVWVDGELTTKMIGGPRNYEAWTSSWEVFRAAMVMLDAATIAGLDKYARGIERLHQLHGQWPMLLLADEKCRGEQWDIMAEKCARDPPAGYSAEHPWRYIIPASAYGPTGPMADWWYYNLVAPLTYQVASPLRMAASFEGSAGTVLEERMGGMPASLRGAGQQGNKRKDKGGSGPSSALASSSSSSMRVCNAWNWGGCKEPCSGGRRHLCSNCGGSHRRSECPYLQDQGGSKGAKGKGSEDKPSGGKKKRNKKAGKGAGKGKPAA